MWWKRLCFIQAILLSKKVIIAGLIYINFPIARFRCRGKGHRTALHKTFSLLPHWLVPYRCYAIDMIIAILRLLIQTGGSLTKTKEVFCNQNPENELPLENQAIYRLKRLIVETFYKICTVPELKQQMRRADCFYPYDPLKAVFEFIAHYQSPLSFQAELSNVEKLSLNFFYQWQSGNYFQRLFLFGTPSQKR